MSNPVQLGGPFVPVKDCREAGIPFHPNSLHRMERVGDIPPFHQRRPGTRPFLGPAHFKALGFWPKQPVEA
jgi:hypothetical protein